MKYYLQVDKDGIIRDAISYPVDGYIEVEVPSPLPPGINGGWYRWDGENPVEVPELKPADEREMEQRMADLEEAIAAILGGAI